MSLEDGFSRRKLLAALGTVSLGGRTFGVVTSDDGDRDYDYYLGEEGLEDGDVIDPYLEQYWAEGVSTYVPPGEYTLEDGTLEGPLGQPRGSGIAQETRLHGGGPGEEAIFHHGDHLRLDWITQDGAYAEFKHLTFRGEVDGGNRIRVEAWEGGEVLVENVNRPDGQPQSPSRIDAGFFVGGPHTGHVTFKNCHIEGFADNGLYASEPGNLSLGYGGSVDVLGGLYKNNNISNIRIGAPNSRVIGAVSVQDGPAPTSEDTRNQRSIWVNEPGDNLLIGGCDVTVTNGYSTAPLLITPRNCCSTGGIVHNCRLKNDNEGEPWYTIFVDEDNISSWKTSGIHITGDGDHSNMLGDTECSGQDCNEPRTEERWFGSDGAGTGDFEE